MASIASGVLALTFSTVTAPAPTSSCYQNEPKWYGLNVDILLLFWRAQAFSYSSY